MVKELENEKYISKSFGRIKLIKGPKQDSQNQLRLPPMPKEDKP
jgi:hypothetical protein